MNLSLNSLAPVAPDTAEILPPAWELEAAALIQQSLQQTTFPAEHGFGVDAFCRSARRIGGDFFDVSPAGEDLLWLTIADVMGKGVPAALFATSLGPLLRSLNQSHCCPAELLTQLNRAMYRELSRADMFITAQIVLADLRRRELWVSSAGHCPLLWAQPDGRAGFVPTENLPLGLEPDGGFVQTRVALEPGACVLLYTDGVTDARDACGEQFGPDRLEEIIRQAAKQHPTAAGVKGNLAAELDRFQAGAPAIDDQTFVVLLEEQASL